MTDPLVGLALIAALGVGCQMIGQRINVPSILLLLGSGIMVGPVLNWLDPDVLLGDLLFPAVSLGVGILLFEGGLALQRNEIDDVSGPLLRLITVGAFVTWIVGAFAIDLLFDVQRSIAFLMGAVLVVSGPTVVIPLLRLVNVRPMSASLLKWEGIVIDPIGALLAVVVLEAVLHGDTPVAIGWRIFVTLVGGGLVGAFVAWGLAEGLARHYVPDRLHNAVTLTAVVAAFVLADQVSEEAGLTATTVMGIYLANQRRAPVAHIAEFEEDLGVLVLGSLFIILGARIDLDAVAEYLVPSLGLLAILVLIARPLAVFVSTVRSNVPVRDRLFMAAMAPRGIVAAAVASLFSLELAEAGVDVPQFTPVIFTVIIGSVITYSIAGPILSRVFRVKRAEARGLALIGGASWVLDLAERLTDLGVPTLVVTSNEKSIGEAVMRGVLVYSGRIDSEDLISAAEGTGVSMALGLANSDAENDLALRRLAELVGRANLFHLPVSEEQTPHGSGTHAVIAGRHPFGSEVTRRSITKMIEDDARIRRLSRQPNPILHWLPLVVVTPDGLPRIADDNEVIDPGELVIGVLGKKPPRQRQLPA